MNNPKVAIVHDWLVTYAGAERVLEQMLECFPDADLFALVDFLESRDFVKGKKAKVSFIQRLPWAKKKYRSYLPLMPLAIEQFDLSSYDIVISSSHAVAKGVLTGPHQLHLCMCYSPMRYAWDLYHQYLREANLERGVSGLIARVILHYLRIWDLRTVNGVDHFIAISEFIRWRIGKVYKREAKVIYPPVYIEDFAVEAVKEPYYLTASRLVPYKKVDMIAEAFAKMPDRRLVIIGEGPQRDKVAAIAKQNPNIEYLGYQEFKNLKAYMQKATAFVFAAEEDFGIVPLEAQACGTPVLAYGRGGARETIVEGPGGTGVFFSQQSVEAICEAVETFESTREKFEASRCRQNASRFSKDRFKREFIEFVESSWLKFAGENSTR